MLGAVVLTVTGGEALYADMGHFGKQPIRWGWFGFVLPALVLNYFGQGAVLLDDPRAVANPFYMSVPDWAQVPDDGAGHHRRGDRLAGGDHRRVLGDAPGDPAGLPAAPADPPHLPTTPSARSTCRRSTAMLFAAVIVLVLTFRSSTNLATAYGLSVTGTMLIDTLLLAVVALHALAGCAASGCCRCARCSW